MSKRQPKYTDEFRAEAVLMLESEGYPGKPGALRSIAQKLGVPERTLSRWAKGENNPPPAKLVSEKKGELVDRLEGLLDLMVNEMYTAVEGAGLRELGTAFGITFDKLQLLKGGPTARTESEIKVTGLEGLDDDTLTSLIEG